MRLDQAENIKIGETIINSFSENLTVTGILKRNNCIIFHALDHNLEELMLLHRQVYQKDISDLCDEEQNFIKWATENKTMQKYENIDLIKHIYITAFAAGFNHKKQFSVQELLQK